MCDRYNRTSQLLVISIKRIVDVFIKSENLLFAEQIAALRAIAKFRGDEGFNGDEATLNQIASNYAALLKRYCNFP